MAKKPTRIKYVGPGVRSIGRTDIPGETLDRDYAWTPDNDFIEETTDPVLIENLATYPYPQFEFIGPAAAAQPGAESVTSLAGVTADAAAQLGEHGVATVADLAKASKETAAKLISNTGLTRAQVTGFIEAAKAATSK